MVNRVLGLLALALVLSIGFENLAWASDGGRTLSEAINDMVAPVTNAVSAVIFFEIPLDWLVEGAPGIPFIVLWLFSAALYFSIYMRFINFRGLKQALKVVSGKYDNPSDPGEVTHFQALTAAVSGTVGLGNIAGVALAISIGGPGATFWMILVGLFGMTSKFTECTLGLKYREIDKDGVVSGGAMLYLSKGLAGLGHAKFGRILALIFAVLCIGGAFGAGSMFQVNQSATQFTNVATELTGGESSLFFGRPWIFGSIYAVVAGMVIIGGIRQITRVTELLVPFMAAIYVGSALIILGAHIGEIPGAFGLILKGAFTGEGISGGIVGVLVIGLRRATFSNEAGIGSASIAHAAAKTKEPIAEGLVALLEPMIDTVIICTITALVIIVTGSYEDAGAADGIALTSHAFDTVINGFRYILTVAVVLFAFSTTITWFYYGQRSFLYLVGNKPRADLVFKMMYLFSLIIGSAMQLTAVMDFADAMLLAMGFPNIVGLFMLRKEVRAMMQDYMARLKAGSIKPYKAEGSAVEAGASQT